MSTNTSNITDTSHDLVSSYTNGDGIYVSKFCANEHTNRDSKSRLCPHQLANASARFSDSGSKCNLVNSISKDSSDILDHSDGSIRHNSENENLTSPVITSSPGVNSQEASALITSKRVKSRARHHSVKYSVSEMKPLISDDNYEIDAGYKKISQVMSNPLPRKWTLERTKSLGNISDIPLSTLCKDTPLASETSDQAAPRSPKPARSFDTSAESFKGSLNTQYAPVSDFQPFLHFHPETYHTFRPCLSSGLQHLRPTAQPAGFSKLPPSQIGFCYIDTPLQLPQHFEAGPCGYLCLSNKCSCRASFDKSSQLAFSEGQDITLRSAHLITPHSSSPQDAHVTSVINTSSSPSCPITNTSAPANSTAKSRAQNSESALDYGTPESVSVLKKCSMPLSPIDVDSYQVFVPRIKVITEQINQANLLGNVNNAAIPCHCKSCHSDSLYPLHQLPGSDSSHLIKTSPVHNSVASTSIEKSTFSVENKTRDDVCRENFIVDGSHVRSVNSHPTFSTDAAHHETSYPSFDSHRNNQEVCCCKDGFATHHPQLVHNQSISADHISDLIPNDENQIELGEKLELHPFKPFCSRGCVTSNPFTQYVPGSHPLNMNQVLVSKSGESASNHFALAALETYTTKPDYENSSESNSLSAHECQILSDTNMAYQGPHIIHSNGSHAVERLCPASPLTMNFVSVQRKPRRKKIPKNTSGKPGQSDQIQLYNQHDGEMAISGNELATGNVQTNENGYQATVNLRTAGTYFGGDLLDSPEDLVRSKRDSVRNSLPSSIDSGHPDNKDGSLQRSNTSELGLLKTTSESTRNHFYSEREVPNYSYLCIVATVLNPLFGLAAFLCNHYARKNFRQHKRAQANNLYFATITISTVTIFLTLVGATLLITHVVFVRSEKKWPTTMPSTQSCEGRMFGYDDSLKQFFNIDFNLYCEIIKNEKVMDALKRFWLEDLHNKKKYVKLKPSFMDGNSTHDGELYDVNATNDGAVNPNLTGGVISETSALNTKSSHGSPDADGKYTDSDVNNGMTVVPQLPLPLQESKFSHNTIVSSSDGPVVPPELEGEYRQYLEGNKRTKVSDLNPFLHGSVSRADLSVQSSVSLENRPTTENTTGNISTVTITDGLDQLVNSDSSVNPHRNATDEIDNLL